MFSTTCCVIIYSSTLFAFVSFFFITTNNFSLYCDDIHIIFGLTAIRYASRYNYKILMKTSRIHKVLVVESQLYFVTVKDCFRRKMR